MTGKQLGKKIKKNVDQIREEIIKYQLDDTDKRSLKSFCNDNGISMFKYQSIVGDPNFQAILSDTADQVLKGAVLQVTRSFVNEAVKGSATQQKMYFEMLNKYTQKIEINMINDELKQMSTEDLVKIASSEDD